MTEIPKGEIVPSYRIPQVRENVENMESKLDFNHAKELGEIAQQLREQRAQEANSPKKVDKESNSASGSNQ